MPRHKKGSKAQNNSKKADFVSVDEQGQELYEVERVMDKRVTNGVNEYLVKWKGWTMQDCTWEPESSFLENRDRLDEFFQKNKKKAGFLSLDEEGQALWEIEHVIDKRVRNGVNEYLVKWKGWAMQHCTWEPESSFIANKDILLEFIGMYQETHPNKKVNKRIHKKAKPSGVRKTKRAVQPEIDDSEAIEDTKIVIQRIIVPNQPKPDNHEEQDDGYWTGSPKIRDTYITPQKSKEFFVCKNIGEDSASQMMADEDTTNPSSNSKSIRFLWQCGKKTADSENEDDDQYSQDYSSPRRRHELETDKLAELMSCPSQIKRNGLPPMVFNELENTDEFTIKIIECFTFLKGNSAAPESLRFKVAFFDHEGNLKGYDYFSYEEIKQKNWDSQLLAFFTQEIVEELASTGRSLTRNIKVI